MTAPGIFGVLISIGGLFAGLKEKMNAYLFVSLLCGVAGVYAVSCSQIFQIDNYYYAFSFINLAFLTTPISIMLVEEDSIDIALIP